MNIHRMYQWIDPALSIYGLDFIVYLGDHLKKIVLLIAALCCALLCSSAMAAEKASVPKPALLFADSGNNLTQMNLTLYPAGLNAIDTADVVKFTAPNPNWKLMALQIIGWSGFNNTTQRFPPDRNFLLEVRDKDWNLLYKFADAQNMYFASTNRPVGSIIEIPPLPVTGDFYVLFYDRGAVAIGIEQGPGNGTGNSSFFVNGQLIPAGYYFKKTNETEKFNWLIRAIGE
jgi:hypothetical protein